MPSNRYSRAGEICTETEINSTNGMRRNVLLYFKVFIIIIVTLLRITIVLANEIVNLVRERTQIILQRMNKSKHISSLFSLLYEERRFYSYRDARVSSEILTL